MRVVDLFSGIGGFSLGFKWEGFECVGYDNYKPAIQTYRYNIGEAHLLDLSTYTPKREADVVIAGPPCTPYTTLNFKNRGEKHPAYHLIERTLEIIRDIRPRVYVIENTPSIRSFPNYTLLKEGIEGYDTWELEINYINFGAAIHRKRLFFVGSKVGYFDIPQSLQEKFAKLIDLIGEIAEETEKLAHGDPQAYIYPDEYEVFLHEIDGCYYLQIRHSVFYDDA